MLVPMKSLLLHAQSHAYAIPAFNFYNHPTAQAITEQAQSQQSPVILMTSSRYIKYMGLPHTIALATQAAQNAKIPVSLLLDHGDSYQLALDCANAGFPSLMIDGSRLPITENTRLTQQVASMAHQKNLTVEAELGAVGGLEDAVFDPDTPQSLSLVDPVQAAQFVKDTGIDALAPAIGNVHGLTKQEPHLDLPLLQKVRNAVDIPLVLHGGSGISDKTVQEIIKIGVSKVNVGSEVKKAWRDGLVDYFNSGQYEPRLASEAAKASVKKLVEHKINMVGSAGKA